MVYDTITGFLDSVHPLEFEIPENTASWKLDLFLLSGEGRKTPTLLGPLERTNLNPVIEVSISKGC
jgi:hypothetical protein